MDQLHDVNNATLREVLAKYDFPDYVTTDTIIKEASADLLDEDFALPEAGLFPTNSPANTLTSAAFFLEKAASFSEESQYQIMRNLTTAAMLHGIENDFKKLVKSASPEDSKDEADPSDYAFIMERGKEKIQLYPITSKMDAIRAQEYFEENYAKYPVDWRESIAKGIIKLSYKYGVDITSQKVKEYEGKGRAGSSFNFVKAAAAITERIKYCKNMDDAEKYYKLGDAIIKKAFDGEFDKQQLVNTVKTLDELSGLARLSKRGFFPDPEQVVYHDNEGIIGRTLDLAGEVFTESDLANTPRENFQEALGDDFVQSVSENGKIDISKLMEIGETLPTPDKKMLSAFIVRVGDGSPDAGKIATKPMEKSAAATFMDRVISQHQANRNEFSRARAAADAHALSLMHSQDVTQRVK